MLSLEWWGSTGRGEDRAWRDRQWSRQVRPPRPSQRDLNLENSGSNKRARREADVDLRHDNPEPINWEIEGETIYDRPDSVESRDT